jgi:hypothetical protein
MLLCSDDRLQNTVGGGKAKMKYHFSQEVQQWPIMTRPYKAPPRTADSQNKLVVSTENHTVHSDRNLIAVFSPLLPPTAPALLGHVTRQEDGVLHSGRGGSSSG